jgi:predicted nucleotidyltransferase
MASERDDHRHESESSGGLAIDSIVQEIVDRIVTQVHPLRILVFGSTARGEHGHESDVDLLVVMPDGTHRRRTAQMLYRRLRGFGVPVDLVVTTEGDLDCHKDNPGLIYRTVLREGKELYAA